MTNLIDLPSETDAHCDRKKIPSWLTIAVLAVIAIGTVLILTLTSSDNKTSAEQTKSEAISVFDQLQQACAAESVPVQFQQVCNTTPGARDRVEAATPGIAGSDGTPGAQGVPGVPGAPGANGANGGLGLPGAAGVNGAGGVNGNNGAPGVNGTNGVDGPAGPAGAAGAVGPQGPQGPPGAQGAQGPQGPPGDAGSSGAPGGFPQSYTISHADGRNETCTRNNNPPPDYTCEFTS